jgi:hypothetical protein
MTREIRLGIALALVSAIAPAPVAASVVVSTATTRNIGCSGGVCTPTSDKAVLNVDDLESLLSAGNIEVTTTGSGVQAGDVEIDAPLAWSGSATLTLDAYDSVDIERPVTVAGPGDLSIKTNDGGTAGVFLFGPKGHVAFAETSDALSINGVSYTLVGTLPDLAADIAANPSGAYALAADYDGGQDGTYHSPPIPTTFEGSFNGLGNTVSNLRIRGSVKRQNLALFNELDTASTVSSLRLSRSHVWSSNGYNGFAVAGLAAINYGTIFNSSAGGTIVAKTHSPGVIGGMVGANLGTLDRGASEVKIKFASSTIDGSLVGVLVGVNNGGSIKESYATGTIAASTKTGLVSAGGLLGANAGPVVNCYATASVLESGGGGSSVGGLFGSNIATAVSSYSTGGATAVAGSYIGGLIGDDGSARGDLKQTYWDMTTSGIGDAQGAGNIAHDPGIKGLTTTQLQAGLPHGFDHSIWAQDAKINDGLPYLRGNPPTK